MSDAARQWASLILLILGIGWWLGVEVWRGRLQEHSARVFWLHLTAPLVAIVLLLAAIGLLLGTERLRRARGLPPARRSAAGPDSGDVFGREDRTVLTLGAYGE